ncbi:MAG: hypothetical protein AAF368_14505, partial [Planctomycetota bacterium]
RDLVRLFQGIDLETPTMKRLLPLLCATILISPVQEAAPPLEAGGGFRASLGPHGAPATQRGRKKKSKAPRLQFSPFAGELSAALEQAALRNVPVLIHVVSEDEEANDRYRDGAMQAQELLTFVEANHVLDLAVNGATHDPLEEEYAIVDDEGNTKTRKRTLCSKFRTPTCRGHQLVRRNIISDYSDNGEVRTPLTLVLNPDGSVATRIYLNGEPPAVTTIEKALKEAIAELGPGISEATLKEVQSNLRRGASLEKRSNDPGEAWQAYAQAHALQSRGSLSAKAQAGVERTLEAMKAKLAETETQLVPGSACEAWRNLDGWSKGPWSTSPLASEVKRLIKQAKKDKALKEELKACKLELEAEGLLAQAQEHARRGEEKAATKAWRKLLRKKYDGTVAQERAREARPDLVPKKDG